MLPQIERALRAHGDVVAAWLSGSRGRGTDDDLSDIDIWVAVEDDAIGAINANPVAFVEDIAPTLMHIQAPSIAPPGGVFLLTWMEADVGYEQVDWYWTPASMATRPSATRLLFERHSIPISDSPEPERLDADALIADIDGTIKDSLLLIANSWKNAKRGKSWSAVKHIQHANDRLAKVDWLVSHGRAPEFHDVKRSFLPDTVPVDREETRFVLRTMLHDLASLAEAGNRERQFRDAFAALEKNLSS